MKRLPLSVVLLAIALQASAFQADLDGTTFEIDTVYCHIVGPGVTQSHLTLTSTDRAINIYTSTLSRRDGATAGIVEPRVIIGNDCCRVGENLVSMAERHEANDDYRYLTGINGDFFITSSFASNHEFGTAILGYPNMACAIDGKIAAPDMIDVNSRENALITTADSWYIDATDFKYRLMSADCATTVNAKAINYPRRSNELMVYNSYMGATTATDASGRELVLVPADGTSWAINTPLKFIVDSDWTEGGNSAIPANGIVISCGPDYHNDFIDALAKGDAVNLNIEIGLPAHGDIKPEIVNIIGGDVRILNKGEITREAIRWINTPTARYQRSIVGFSKDRDMMVFVAVDGTGLTYFECAALLKALGCYDGLDLDGGGSTAIWSSNFGIYNQPRDGSNLRAIGNALYFAMKAPVDNTVASLRFADHAVKLPQYGSYTPIVYGYNRYGQLIDTDVKGFTLTAPAALGTTTGSTLVASGAGTHALTATLGDMTTTVAVTVDASYAAAPRHSALLIDNYHATPIQLTANVGNTAMSVSPSAFSWTSDNEAVATVDTDGNILGHRDGTAVITGQRGDLSFSINVTVQCPTAQFVSINPDLDSSAWKATASGTSISSLTIGESPVFDIDFTVKNGQQHRITLRREITLWSLPDALRIKLNPDDALINSITISASPNGGRTVSIKKEYSSTDDTCIEFPLSDFFDTTDPGIYPVTFTSLAINVDAGNGDRHFDILSFDAVYNSFESSVADIVADSPTTLEASIIGSNIVLPFTADTISLCDLTGRVVATEHASASIAAPAPGLYIVTATRAGSAISAKLIVR